MPETDIVFYRDEHGAVPVRVWLLELQLKDRGAHDRSMAMVERLRRLGHEARRPLVDHLGNGIYELRIRHRRVQYRVLYFFGARREIVFVHACQKERAVSEMDIRRASIRRDLYLIAPHRHGTDKEADD